MIKNTFDMDLFTCTTEIFTIIVFFLFSFITNASYRKKIVNRKEENYCRLPDKSHKCRFFVRHAIATCNLCVLSIKLFTQRRERVTMDLRGSHLDLKCPIFLPIFISVIICNNLRVIIQLMIILRL